MNSIAISASSSVEQSKILKFFTKALPVGFFIILSIFLFNFNTQKVEAAACNATASGTWGGGSDTASFTSCTGSAANGSGTGNRPASGDTLTINAGVALTLAGNVQVAGITIAANTATTTALTLTGFTLTNTGTLVCTVPGANSITTTIAVATGTLANTGLVALNASATSRVCSITQSTGTVTLGNGITFSGSTPIYNNTAAGVINLNGGTFGSGGTVTINSGTALNVGGTSTLSQAKTFGAVNINSGTLTLGVASIVFGSTTNIADAATLRLGNFAFTQSGNLTIGTGTGGTVQVAAAGSTGSYTFSNAITVNAGGSFNLSTGTHAVVFGGTGTITNNGGTFNAGTGAKTYSGTGAKAFAGSSNMTLGGTMTIPTNRQVTISNSGTVTLGALTMATAAVANTFTINNGSNVVVTGALSFSGNASATTQLVTLGSGAGAGNLTVGSIAMTGGGGANAGGGKIACSAGGTGTLTVSGAGAITITGSSTASNTGLVSIDMSAGACNVTTGTTTTPLTLAGGSTGATPSALFKMGTGILTLNGALAFTGGTANKAQFNMASNGGSIVLTGGTLPAVGTAGSYIITASTNITSTGTSAINYATAVPNWGALNLNGGTLSLAAAENFTSMSLANGVTLAPGANLVTNTGDLTCGSGGSATISGSGGLTLSGASAVLGGGTCNVTNSGTFTVSGGTAPTVSSGATYVFSGPLSVSTLLTNSGIVTASNALSGAGNFVNAAGSTLNIGFATTPAITTLTATGTTPDNLVNYTAASPSCEITAYDDLTFSGSGTVTCDITSVSDQLTLSTATSLGFTTGANLVVGALTTIGSGATLTQGATFDFTTGGLTTTGTGTFTNTGIGDFTLSGDVNNAGTIVLNSGNLSSCTEGTDSILVRSTVSNTLRSWSGAGTFTLRNLDVDDMTGTLTAGNSVFSGDTTWTEACSGATYSGTLYTDEGVTLMTSGPTVSLKVNGAGAYSAVANGSGVYSITNVAVTAGQTVTIFLDTNGGNQANLITEAAGTGNVSGLNLYQNRVIIRHEDAGPATNTDLDQYDNAQDSDMLFTVGAPNVDFENGAKVIVWTGDTYTPTGYIITSSSNDGTNSNPDGDIDVQASATLDMPGNNLFVGGDFSNLGTANLNLVNFEATATGHEIELGGSVPNQVVFNGSGGGWSFQSAVNIDSNLTVTAGTLTGTNNITLNGGGYATGNGVINLTGGTFQSLGSGGNFGGDSNWTFNNLTFSNGVRSDTFTAAGTGSVTVTGVMTVSANSTLNAGSKVWTLSGSSIPFVNSGTFNAQTSTFQYTGTSATNITAATYNNLSLIPAATVTYTLGTATSQTFNINGDFLAGNGTNALTVGQSTFAPVINALGNFTLAGNLADWLDGGTAQINLKPTGTKTFGFLTPVGAGLSVGTVTIGSGTSTPKILLNGAVRFDHLTVAAAHELDLASYGLYVTGVGTGASRPFLVNGTFTSSTGNVIYGSSVAATTTEIQAGTYYDLSITPNVTAGHTYTLGTATSQTITVQNNFLVSDGSIAVTANATTYDPILDVNGSVTIDANGTFVASDSSAFTIANNFTNSGTFTHSSGTVTFDTTATTTILGATTFNNFTSIIPNKTLQFQHQTSNVPIITIAGTFNVAGTAGNLLNLYSDLSGTTWEANFSSLQSISYINLRDGGCHAGTATVNLTNSNSVSNNASCWNSSTTTIGDGTNGAPVTIAPGASATEVDRFSLATSSGADTVTGLTVTIFGDAIAYTNIGTVGVYTTASALKCSATPSSNTVALTTCGISVTTTPTDYVIKVTPKSHTAMAAVPGAQYPARATVTSVTATNTITGTDSNSSVFTVDNLSPSGVSSSVDFGTTGVVTGAALSGAIKSIAKDSTYMYAVGTDDNFHWRIEKRLLSTGAVDSGFGTSGVVTGGVTSEQAYGVSIDSTYMYVVGYDTNFDLRIEKRLLSDGSLVGGFGTSGVVTGDTLSSDGNAIAIDSTYMYVAGLDDNVDFRIEKRLLSDGSLVSGFGTSGVVTGVTASNNARAISIDSTYMYVAGVDLGGDLRIEKRLLSTGAVDSGFGTSGVITGTGASDSAYGISIDSTYMYVAGYDSADWRIEKRLLSTGAVDSGFGTSGVVTGAAASSVLKAISIDSTYMYLAGFDSNASLDWRIEKRLLSTGALDSGFGTSGAVLGAAATDTANAISIGSKYLYVGGFDSSSNWRIEKRLLSNGGFPAIDSAATVSAGVGLTNLSWTNPVDPDVLIGGTVVVLRRTTSVVTDVPVEGTTYTVGNTIGSSTVACVVTGSAPATTCQDTGLTGGTPYYYKIFAQDSNGNYDAGTTPSGSPVTPTIATVLGNGTDGSSSTVGPGSSATEIDRFSLNTTSSTDTVTGMTVTLAGNASAYTNIATVDVQTTASVSKCSVTPSSNTVVLTTCGISVTTTPTDYKILITPKSHAAMAAVPGASYTTTATVTSITATNSTSGADSGSAVITVDNASPAGVTSSTATPGGGLVDLAWTNPSDTDFTTSGTVVVLRRTTSVVTDVPVEGTTYTVGNTIGSSTVACVVTGSAPATTCQDTGLTPATPYYYKIFTEDSRGNYDAGTTPSGSPATPTTVGARTISGNVYSEEFNTATSLWPGCGAGANISMSINGGAKSSVACAATTGVFAFTNRTLVANDIITIYMDTNGGDKAVTYTRAVDANTDITGLALIRDTAMLRYEIGSSITNANINIFDKTNDTDIPLASDGTNIVGDTGVELHIDPSMTYSPGGTVNVNDMHVKGTFTGAGQNVTINDGLFIDASGVFNAPSATLFLTGNLINDGTFNANGGTVNMNLGRTYQLSKPITIDRTMVVGGTQTNFPVMIAGTFDGTSGKPNLKHGSSGGQVMNVNGYDIAFFADSNLKMKLRHEVEKYDGATGDAVFWVRIPALSSAVDTTIYMAYRNPGVTVDQSDPKNVWSNGYSAVWHMADTGGTLTANDSTKNGKNGSLVGNVAAIGGKIGTAANFDGVGDSIDAAVVNTKVNDISFEFWFNGRDTSAFRGMAFFNGTGSNGYGLAAGSNDGGSSTAFNLLGQSIYWRNTTVGWSQNTWMHIFATLDTSNIWRLYQNGSLVYTSPANTVVTAPTGATIMGNESSGGSNSLSHYLDEVRFSDSVRNANWIGTEYNNQNSPATFYSFGTDSASGSSTIIAGTNNITFNNFTVSSANGGGKFLKFKSSGAYTFNGAFSAVGQPGNILSIASTVPTSPWVATFNGSSVVSYASVRDSSCTGGNAITSTFTNVNLGGNGNCFVFKSLNAGTTAAAGGETGNAASGPTTGGGIGGPGSIAKGIAVLTSNAVTSVTIQAGGFYESTPTVSFCGGGGTGAAGTAVLTNRAVTSVTMNGNGSGYSTPPIVLFNSNCPNTGGGAGGGAAGGDSGFLYDGTNYAAAGGAGVDANISPIKYVLGLLGLVILVVLIRIFI